MRIIAVLLALALSGCTLSGLGAAARIGKERTVMPERVEREQPGKAHLMGAVADCSCPEVAPTIAAWDDNP
jgi:hypothetical protein